MRLDKFLKVSRILKRRTVANEACHGGKVSVNGRTAKPGAQIKPGDKVAIAFAGTLWEPTGGTGDEGKAGAQIKPGDKVAIAFAGGQLVFVVNQVKESVKKDEAAQMYTILQDE